MKIGTIDFDDSVDTDNEMQVSMEYGNGEETYEFLTPQDAKCIIQHLQTYFKIPV